MVGWVKLYHDAYIQRADDFDVNIFCKDGSTMSVLSPALNTGPEHWTKKTGASAIALSLNTHTEHWKYRLTLNT